MKYCDECHSTYPSDFTTCPKDKSALRSLTELTPGAILRDKYEVLERIGTGGMATVYKARHVTFNEIKALKVVSNKLMDDQEFLRRFRTEAIITRKLHHPNAVALDDFDTTADGRPFIVMEFVKGRSLRSWIHDLGSLPPKRALNIAKQVASALGAAHKLGIVHRDIKPDNIIVLPQHGGDDIVKVFDFGIAKVHRGAGVDMAEENATTKTGMVVGTPQYVSPEQASGRIGDLIDGRSDLYSLGIVLYEMLTGRLPFKSDTPVGYLIHHLQTAPTPPSGLKPPAHVNDSISALLMKALEKDRELRFQSAEDMIAALEKPESVARTVVLGSNATLGAPIRTAHGSPVAVAAPARVNVPKAGASPAVGRQQPITTSAQWPSVSAGTAEAAPSSVYEGPDATVWQPQAAHAFNWRKFAAPAALVLVLIIAIGYWARRAAENSAAQNQVSSTNEQDAALKAAIQDQFQDSDSLKSQKIDVRVSDGNVFLHGRVNKPYLTEIAGALARDVDGVKNVQNDIEVVEAPEQQEQIWRSQANNQAQTAQAQPPRQLAQSQANQPTTSADRTFIQNAVRQFNMRGAARLQRGDYNGAQRAFRNALRLDPNNRPAQLGLKRAQAGARQ